MLFKKNEVDKHMDKCHVGKMTYEWFMFPGQETLQPILVIIAVLMIPIMLLGKPLTILWRRRQMRQHYASINEEPVEDGENVHHDDEEESGFGDILIIQGHCYTCKYCYKL